MQQRDLAAPEEATQEFFSRYGAQRWHPAQPLVVVHQWYESGDDTGAYRHEDFFALYVVRGGRGTHVIDGQPYAVTRGDVYATPPGAIHRYRDYHNLRAEAFCFQAHLFSADDLDALRALPGFWSLFLPAGPAQTDVLPHYQLHLSPERYREIEGMMAEMFAEMVRTDALPALVRNLLFRMLVTVARTQAEWRSVQPMPRPTSAPITAVAGGPTVTDVLRLCEERFAEQLTVPQLAALLFLSPGHFSALFSREAGVPPATYIRRLRLERAQTLLRTTTLSATEIAHQTGFGDSAALSRAFRTVLGTTPTTYRARSSHHAPSRAAHDGPPSKRPSGLDGPESPAHALKECP